MNLNPEQIILGTQLFFSVAVAGYLLKFLTNHLTHDVAELKDLLRQILETLRRDQ